MNHFEVFNIDRQFNNTRTVAFKFKDLHEDKCFCVRLVKLVVYVIEQYNCFLNTILQTDEAWNIQTDKNRH